MIGWIVVGAIPARSSRSATVEQERDNREPEGRGHMLIAADVLSGLLVFVFGVQAVTKLVGAKIQVQTAERPAHPVAALPAHLGARGGRDARPARRLRNRAAGARPPQSVWCY
jgi:hypothetical protein